MLKKTSLHQFSTSHSFEFFVTKIFHFKGKETGVLLLLQRSIQNVIVIGTFIKILIIRTLTFQDVIGFIMSNIFFYLNLQY